VIANAFLIRVQDHAGALERVLSTLRRKYLGMEKISLFPGPRGTHEVLIRTSLSGPPPHRVKAELAGAACRPTSPWRHTRNHWYPG
jgi:hypothetical protein